MTALVGGAPDAAGCQFWLVSHAASGIVYEAPTDRIRGLVELARPILLDRVPSGTGTPLALDEEGPLRWLGDEIVRHHGLGAPLAALAHRDLALAYHRDTRNPYPCVNATVFLRRDVTGGLLVFPDARVALPCGDGCTAVFDGQRLHGNTPLTLTAETGYRIALTYYCPTKTQENPGP